MVCSSVLQAVPSVHMEDEEEKENRDAALQLLPNAHSFTANTLTPNTRTYIPSTREVADDDGGDEEEEEEEEDDDSFFTSMYKICKIYIFFNHLNG